MGTESASRMVTARRGVKKEEAQEGEGAAFGAGSSAAVRRRGPATLDESDDEGANVKPESGAAKMDEEWNELLEDEKRTREEQRARTLIQAMDTKQYFPITLNVGEEAPPVQGAAPGSVRQDMNGPAAVPNPVEEAAWESLAARDGQQLVNSGDGFLLFQFPTKMPEIYDDSPSAPDGGGPTSADPPAGGVKRLGKLHYYSDGSAELEVVGGVTLEVSPGTLSECRHELAVFNAEEEKSYLLGSVSQKLVCTPKLFFDR